MHYNSGQQTQTNLISIENTMLRGVNSEEDPFPTAEKSDNYAVLAIFPGQNTA